MSHLSLFFRCVVPLCLLTLAAPSRGADIPHFQQKGAVHQLIVQGKPFLLLGGEAGNSTTFRPYMDPFWARFRALHLNTALFPVYWEMLEPDEGKFNFDSVDALIDSARKNRLRLVLLWFGAWKNSMSTYVPAWVKRNESRFPHAKDGNGQSVEILSPFSQGTLDADARAFAALMRHLRGYDARQQTVLMVQVENEIGMLPTARDHSPAANAAFAQPVPRELLGHLQSNRDTLVPELRQRWDRAGGKKAGTWSEVFGQGAETEEIFMAWHYARFVNELARRGKAEYALPMYLNAALNRPGRKPGEYPSAGPVPHLVDIYQAGAPSIDMLSPDIYFFNFRDWTARYLRPKNPLFIPETLRSGVAASNLMVAVAQGAIGYSPFAIESYSGAEPLLAKTYSALGHLAPLVLARQGESTLFAVAPKINYDGTFDEAPQTVTIGSYSLTVDFDPRPPTNLPSSQFGPDPSMRGAELPVTGGLVLFTSPDEYFVLGHGLTLRHASTKPGEQVGLLSVEEWSEQANGSWAVLRRLNGDETHQGRHIRLLPYQIGLQRVRLYRYH